MRDELDRFYTKQEEAARLLHHIDLEQYDLKIEPSAGSGSFSKLVEDCLAYDIAPSSPEIIEQDFLKLEKLPPYKKLLIFGNPPFGKRSSLAKQFITHSINLGASTIAFILPKTFTKRLNQTMFPENWRLIKKVSLTDSSFMMGTEEIYIPCDFFIWTKDENLSPGVNLREQKPKTPTEFRILPRGDKKADFSINGNNGKLKEISEITNPKAEHYIQVVKKEKFQEIKETLKNLKYDFVSSVNGGVAWINREDVFRAFNELSELTDED